MDHPPHPAPGPIASDIQVQWNLILKAYEGGEVYEYYLSVCEAKMGAYRTSVQSSGGAAKEDMQRAEHFHLAALRALNVRVARDEAEHVEIRGTRDLLVREQSTLGQFVLRTLSVAHGAIVLGALAFIGNNEEASIQRGFVYVIISSSVGFLLTLLSAHLATILFQKPVKLLYELSAPRLPVAQKVDKFNELSRSFPKMLWILRPLGYLSALLLVASLTFGTIALITPTEEAPEALVIQE